jgi:ferredoxin-NADP reductase
MAQQLKWQLGTVVEIRRETPKAKSLILDVPDWTTHLAGQHVDVRLTAEDGYQAQRSYSIGSPPEDKYLMLTVERIEDGEISPYLTDEPPFLGINCAVNQDQLKFEPSTCRF